MSGRGKNVIGVVVLSIICGLIMWHIVHWHCVGMYVEMFNWVGTDKVYITVLYNLGLMLVLGAALGFLTEKITDLISHKV